MCSTVLKVLFYTNVKLHAFNLLNVTYTHVKRLMEGVSFYDYVSC